MGLRLGDAIGRNGAEPNGVRVRDKDRQPEPNTIQLENYAINVKPDKNCSRKLHTSLHACRTNISMFFRMACRH